MSDAVIVSTQDAISWVRLNRPDRGNSVTPAVIEELREAFERLGEDEGVRAIVFTGVGKVFCAGADVQDMYRVQSAEGADGLMTYLAEVWMPAVQRLARALFYTPKPVVAAFNGAATAGGLDFGLACDARVAAETAKFAESYINLGMVPVAGGAFLLPMTIGPAAASELLSSARLIDAHRAHELGMVYAVCAPEALEQTAAGLARSMSHGPAQSLAHIKQISRASYAPQFERALDASYQANVDLIARGAVRAKILEVMERYSTGRAPGR